MINLPSYKPILQPNDFQPNSTCLGAVHVAAQQGDVAKLQQLSHEQLREAGGCLGGSLGVDCAMAKWWFNHDLTMI